MPISENLCIDECPEFFKMMDEAANKSEKTVCLMNIEGYQTLDEAYLLMRQLWVAKERGIVITFIPKSEK